MTAYEFCKKIRDMEDSTGDGRYLVFIRYKYKCEKEYSYTLEYVYFDMDGDAIWDSDWWEGQEDVEYLDIISIERMRENLEEKYKQVKESEEDGRQ